MNKLIKSVMLCGAIAAAALLAGCSTTKTRSIDLAGMYASDSGQLAIGSVKVQAIEQGTEAALINYSEDNAWLAPTMKLHEISITLTGTNAVSEASAIVEAIAEAFTEVAPSIKDSTGVTLYDLNKARAELKAAAKTAQSETAQSGAVCTDCADSVCTDCEAK